MRYLLNTPVLDENLKPIKEEYGNFTIARLLKSILVNYQGEKLADVFGAMIKLNEMDASGVVDLGTDEVTCIRDAIKNDKRPSFFRQQALVALEDEKQLPIKEVPKNVKR